MDGPQGTTMDGPQGATMDGPQGATMNKHLPEDNQDFLEV